MRIVQYAATGFVAWATFRPGARPRRLVDDLLNRFRPPPVATSIPRLTDTAIAADAPRYVFVGHTLECGTNTGVQRVVRGLCRAYLEAELPVRFVKWDGHAKACVLIDSEERAYLGRWNGPRPSPSEYGVYPPKGRIPKAITPRKGVSGHLIVPEVTHLSLRTPSLASQLIAWARGFGLRSGFIFYDAIPLERPEFSAMALAHAQYMRELRLADTVWPISRWSADDLASFWGASADVDNGDLPEVRPIHLPAEFDRPRTSHANGGERLILAVGTLEPRKNQTALIRAFQAILAERPGCDWRLVLAGNLHPDVATAVKAASQPGSAIEFLGHVSDAELSDLYGRCAFTVFASVSEGFGLPILESLWHAKPCLCADFGAMAEVAAAGGCLAVDVRDDACLKAGIERLMDDEDLRLSLAQAAVGVPVQTWSAYLGEVEAAGSGHPNLIYYWVNSTVSFPVNTGIQRVARQLARMLIEAGFHLVPVKWGGPGQPFHPPSDKELAHFAAWNGPPVEGWHAWVEPTSHMGGGWFVMTELPLDLTEAEQKIVRGVAEAAKLKTAAVFYDTIPWKLREIYPKPFSDRHLKYIQEIFNYSTVLSISKYSRDELAAVFLDEFGVAESRLGHVRVCTLAGEFPEKSATKPAEACQGKDMIEILCVGSVESRKNHERLLDAFELAQHKTNRPMHLTIVGRSVDVEPDLTAKIRRRAKEACLDWEEAADDARVRQLYDACDFTVYPSIEEGFGLPILESLWHGKPCICANFGAMLEVAAEGGGCLTVDVTDADTLADAICEMANSPDRIRALAAEATARTFRSWRDYASDVAEGLGLWTFPSAEVVLERRKAMGLTRRPRLSVCISTYNRAEWLSATLRNIGRLYPEPLAEVEFVICDNTSSDHTPEVVRPYLTRPDFVYRRNRANVGMLGNLRETAHASSGDYIWILGDDDLVQPGAIERVLDAIKANPSLALVYLNYAFTRIDDARTVTNFDRFFAEATPIVPAESDKMGPIRAICARNENFFTAIYTLVFRRDHGLKAYSQDTSGRPFSTMLTAIPTTYYVLNNMMEEPGMWIGEPLIVVNMNVSWMRYAPLWILERIPEVYEEARAKGAPIEDVDRWRRHTLPSVEQFFSEIFANDPLNNAAYLDVARLVRRFADLPEFQSRQAKLRGIYAEAHGRGHPAAAKNPDVVFGPSMEAPTASRPVTVANSGG